MASAPRKLAPVQGSPEPGSPGRQPLEDGPPAVSGMQSIHDTLRQLILNGDLKAGSEISQLELGRQLGVGRTPLREALRLLEREGLVVDNGPHRPVQISRMSMVDLDDLYSLRVMGEALAVWLTVPTLRDEDFERLHEDVENAADPVAHRRFHSGLRVGAGSRLQEHLERLFEHAERYQVTFMRTESVGGLVKLEEHRAILAACQAREREHARDLLVDHIASTAVMLMTAERHAPFALSTAVRMAKAGGLPPAGG